MGSVTQFLPGLAAGSTNVNTGSAVVDGGAELAATVLGFIGGLVEDVFGAIES